MREIFGEAYVIFEKGNADIDPFDHVQKVGLKNERLAGMIEHSGSSIEFLKVRQVLADVFHELEQLVLMNDYDWRERMRRYGLMIH